MEKKSVDKFVKAQSFENFKSFGDLEKSQIILKIKKKAKFLSNLQAKIITKKNN